MIFLKSLNHTLYRIKSTKSTDNSAKSLYNSQDYAKAQRRERGLRLELKMAIRRTIVFYISLLQVLTMAELDFQKLILGTLSEMKNSIETLKKDINYLTEYIGDTKLSEEERKQLDESISKIKSGNTSDFISWKTAKKELGM